MARAVSAVGAASGPVHGIIAHSVGCAATTVALTRGLEAGRAVLIASPVRYRGPGTPGRGQRRPRRSRI